MDIYITRKEMVHPLEIDFTWQQNDINSFLPIILALLFFSVYWFITKSEKIKKWFYDKNEHDEASVRHITFNRIAGFVLMGIFPLIICLIFLPGYALADFGLTWNSETAFTSLIWIIGLSVVVIPVAYFSAQKPENLVNYPQIRAKIWTTKTVIINAAGWALYLFGYELLFRGVLLFPVAAVLGIWPAIAINIALYAATHIPKGMSETIGAAPLGLILCILTLSTGTIWIAFFVHLAMALTNGFTALKFQPDMKFIHSGK